MKSNLLIELKYHMKSFEFGKGTFECEQSTSLRDSKVTLLTRSQNQIILLNCSQFFWTRSIWIYIRMFALKNFVFREKFPWWTNEFPFLADTAIALIWYNHYLIFYKIYFLAKFMCQLISSKSVSSINFFSLNHFHSNIKLDKQGKPE